MAITTSCCLNLSSPTPASKPNPSSLPSRTTQPLWQGNEKWRKQCVVGMACMIMGLQVDSVAISSAKDTTMMPAEAVAVADSKGNNNVPRWSDKRKCPPWHLNSLETIVPENLPRPAARRRWEKVDFSKINNAPPRVIELNTPRSISDCFSM